jgi:putative GTP pyrophosphokinase
MPVPQTPPNADEPIAKSPSLSKEQVSIEYSRLLPALNMLSAEVKFTIDDALSSAAVSVASIDLRVKTLDSTLRKFIQKEYSELALCTDLVGARVICMFRSDLDRVKSLLEQSFDIIEYDDKSLFDPESFGYMSLHLLARIKSSYEGPRYSRIKDHTFELQIRTICMHAWSSMQHSLQYKGNWDVPNELKKDINALSAIFYLADTQFESVYAAKLQALARSVEISSKPTEPAFDIQPLNYETLAAYAIFKFPNRAGHGSFSYLSTLLHEIREAGITTVGELDSEVDRGLRAMLAEDELRDDPFTAVGAIRVALANANEAFCKVTYGGPDEVHQPFIHLVDP